MPYSWTVDPALRVAFVRGWGQLRIEEALEAPHELLADPAFDPEYGVLVDLREIQYEPRSDDVVAVAQNLLEMAPRMRSRIGVVVREDLAIAAELGAAMASAGGFPLRVFSDPQSARAWLAGGDPDDE